MSLHRIFADIVAVFQTRPSRPLDTTGATDGYCNQWGGVAAVNPDFSGLAPKREE